LLFMFGEDYSSCTVHCTVTNAKKT